MTEKVKIWNTKDGVYRNEGSVNPVLDKDAAHSMAIAENKAYQKHAKAKEILANPGPGVPNDIERLRRLAETDPAVLADVASEKVRSNIGGQNIERGKVLFNLVKMEPTPPTPEQPPTTEQPHNQS